MLKKLINVDVIAGLGALGFAAAVIFVPELSALCDPKVAAGFGLAALARGYVAASKAAHG